MATRSITDLAIELYGAQIVPVLALRPEWSTRIDAVQEVIFGASGIDSDGRGSLYAVAGRCGIHPLLCETLLSEGRFEGAPSELNLDELGAYLTGFFRTPGATLREQIDELTRAGRTVGAIVLLAQAAGFLSYLSRVLYGLSMLIEQKPENKDANEAPLVPHRPEFTMQPLHWEPWLPSVQLDMASYDQLQALEQCGAIQRDSSYFRLLAHHPASLTARTVLYNGILFDRGGLSRTEREFATVAVSRFNGCVYCASIHARRYAQLARTSEDVEAFLQIGASRALPARLQAIAAFAEKLSALPGSIAYADGAVLRRLEFAPVELLDLVHASAMFAWANRLMLTLGSPHPTAGKES